MEGRDGQVFRRIAPLREVPRLSVREVEFLRGGGVLRLEGQWRRRQVELLRRLLRVGVIEVVGVNPAVYRVTGVGVVALKLGARR